MAKPNTSTRTPDQVAATDDVRPEIARQARTEMAARRGRLDRAQSTLAAVMRREVGLKHCDRARWEREASDARAEVAEAARRVRAGEA